MLRIKWKERQETRLKLEAPKIESVHSPLHAQTRSDSILFISDYKIGKNCIYTADIAITTLLIFIIIYKYSTQTYKQALDHVHWTPSPYWGQICNFQLLLWLSCILDQSFGSLIYVAVVYYFPASKSFARYLKIHEYIAILCLMEERERSDSCDGVSWNCPQCYTRKSIRDGIQLTPVVNQLY